MDLKKQNKKTHTKNTLAQSPCILFRKAEHYIIWLYLGIVFMKRAKWSCEWNSMWQSLDVTVRNWNSLITSFLISQRRRKADFLDPLTYYHRNAEMIQGFRIFRYGLLKQFRSNETAPVLLSQSNIYVLGGLSRWPRAALHCRSWGRRLESPLKAPSFPVLKGCLPFQS